VVEMDLDEDRDPKEPKAPADGDNGNVSDLDSEHDE
jgi:hypothetical protein